MEKWAKWTALAFVALSTHFSFSCGASSVWRFDSWLGSALTYLRAGHRNPDYPSSTHMMRPKFLTTDRDQTRTDRRYDDDDTSPAPGSARTPSHPHD